MRSQSVLDDRQQDMKEFQEAMQGYHDLIDTGRREIYQLEQ